MSNNSIQAKILRNMVTIAIVSILLWSILWIRGEYSNFKIDSEQLRLEYITAQKSEIKLAVKNIVNLINLRRKQTKNNLKNTIRERVDTAHLIASTLYAKNVNSKTPGEIGKIIKDVLRPIRFDNGQGYYFAGSMNGVEILYPVRPEVEGQNVINLQDVKGNFVMQDEMRIIKKAGKGFVVNYWQKPGTNYDQSFPKISFIKYFKPLDWYFGSGAYLDEAKQQNQKQLINRLAIIRFGVNGYFFEALMTVILFSQMVK